MKHRTGERYKVADQSWDMGGDTESGQEQTRKKA